MVVFAMIYVYFYVAWRRHIVLHVVSIHGQSSSYTIPSSPSPSSLSAALSLTLSLSHPPPQKKAVDKTKSRQLSPW